MGRPGVVIISEGSDLLGVETTKCLQQKGIWVEVINPYALADCRISISDESVYLSRSLIGGIFFRSSPDSRFSEGFLLEDRDFSDAEVRATWLAALHAPSVLGINRPDAAAWFEGLRWTIWRRHLLHYGVPVSDFLFGDSDKTSRFWHPYSGTPPERTPEKVSCRVLGSALTSDTADHTSLAIVNHILSGKPSANVTHAARILSQLGTYVVEIVTDSEDRVLSVNTQPIISHPETLKQSADLIARCYDAHLTSW